MKKTIILNETKFNRLTYLLREDSSMSDARDRFKYYNGLADDGYFKNPNLNPKDTETTTYNQALKNEMNEIVETIYSVYEKISHNIGAFYSRATDEDPKDDEKPTYKRIKWMHPATFYVEDAYIKNRIPISDKKEFLYQCRCYYTLILRIYSGGAPVWANLFFNPKYKAAKADFFKCIKFSLGKLGRVSVGVLNKETNSYPEGSINWIRNKRANSATEKTYGDVAPILNRDFQAATFELGQQYSELIPKQKQKIIDWYIKAQKDPSMYEQYLIKEQPKVANRGVGRRRFGIRR